MLPISHTTLMAIYQERISANQREHYGHRDRGRSWDLPARWHGFVIWRKRLGRLQAPTQPTLTVSLLRPELP
jgi:hypothetical protein